MSASKDIYILGIPIETEIGEVDFLKVKDYFRIIHDLQIVAMSKDEIIYRYKEMNKDNSLDELIEMMESISLYEMSVNLPDLRNSYHNVFKETLQNEDSIESIDEENFDSVRSLILDMNCVQEEEINPNPEIQRALERSKRVKARGQESITLTDMCSSIVVNSGISYEDIGNFTIYQLQMTFARVGAFKNYDTQTLFATVSEKAEIESWSKHIDLYEKESHTVSKEEFKGTTGKIVN